MVVASKVSGFFYFLFRTGCACLTCLLPGHPRPSSTCKEGVYLQDMNQQVLPCPVTRHPPPMSSAAKKLGREPRTLTKPILGPGQATSAALSGQPFPHLEPSNVHRFYVELEDPSGETEGKGRGGGKIPAPYGQLDLFECSPPGPPM
ncbi:hypothetical protein LZ31DRAFT_42201 [Colletotrichum somersetense]|nr:hypothetical protein LZ31DRAFT_42201 [Colletotrichum somersetense]